MNLSDYVDSMSVLDEVFEHKTLKVTPRTKAVPTLEDALKITERTVQTHFVKTMAAPLIPAIQATLDNYIVVNGAYDTSEDKDAWTSGLDDQVELVIENYVPYLSQDWLGTATIDTGIQLEGGVETFCNSLGKEMYKQQTYHKTPAQILASAAIATGEVTRWLEEHIEKGRGDQTESTSDSFDLVEVVDKMRAYLGAGFNIMDVYDDLDLASDTDDILAVGAAPRLGIDAADVAVLQAVRAERGNNAPQYIFDLITASEEEEKPSKKSNTKAKAAPKSTSSEEGDTVSADVLVALKECGGVKDSDMAKAIGVSRATYNNWLKKDEVTLTQEQVDVVREEISSRIERLSEALTSLPLGE